MNPICYLIDNIIPYHVLDYTFIENKCADFGVTVEMGNAPKN